MYSRMCLVYCTPRLFQGLKKEAQIIDFILVPVPFILSLGYLHAWMAFVQLDPTKSFNVYNYHPFHPYRCDVDKRG